MVYYIGFLTLLNLIPFFIFGKASYEDVREYWHPLNAICLLLFILIIILNGHILIHTFRHQMFPPEVVEKFCTDFFFFGLVLLFIYLAIRTNGIINFTRKGRIFTYLLGTLGALNWLGATLFFRLV